MQLLLLANNDVARAQIHDYLCQECGGYRQGYGRIEVHSFLPKRKERTLEARSEVLEMLEVKEDRQFGGLDDGSPKVKWMRPVYPQVDYTQAPWTVVMLRQPSQSIHTSSEAQTFRRRFRVPHVFSWAPLLVGDTAEALVSSFATTSRT